jgi:hypothetical protein
VVDAEDELPGGGEGDEFLGVGCRGGERFLDQHMFAGKQGRLGQRVVGGHRGGKGDGGEVGTFQRFRERGGALGAGILAQAAGEAVGVFLDDDDGGE